MRFIMRRLVFYLVAAWSALTINFLLPHLLPGTAVEAMLSHIPDATPTVIKALDIQYGVGHQGSLLHQYFVYLGHLAHGNLGTSTFEYPTKVISVLNNTLPWTIGLVGTATIVSFGLGTLLGILAGWRRNGLLDKSLPAWTFLQATPYFFLALLVVELLSNTWHVFPPYGGVGLGIPTAFNWTFISSVLDHSVLPAATIIVTSMAGWMLQMRNVMITTIGEDYVLAATAKGLSPRRIMFTYAARNAILPNIAGFALAIGFVVAGALVTEIVFSYPGVGYQLYTAVQNDDIPTMQGIFLAFSVAVLLACLLADVVYVLADPRTRTRAAY
ncbi:MAG: ABC transporter permease [Solirubrobacteraceae bacterium]|jgi:peptide/nickel transport system permease protein